ncbi:DUF1661 domain-containing protein [Porphyromonas gulae]|nr:DUF1661 domain-containing protein [Porphyromonas gulae]
MARKFFISRATVKKFSRHVLGSVKRGNFGVTCTEKADTRSRSNVST